MRALKIKRSVVEIDPTEKGLRRVLNFGHTIGHAVESQAELGSLLHGECVAIGMMPMCSHSVRARIKAVLEKYSLPTSYPMDGDSLISFRARDKKAKGNRITVIYVNEIGSFEEREIEIDEMKKYIRGISE